MKKSEIERHARRDAMVAETARLAAESQPKTSGHTLEDVIKERDEARDACYRVNDAYEATRKELVDLRAVNERLATENTALRAELQRLQHQPGEQGS